MLNSVTKKFNKSTGRRSRIAIAHVQDIQRMQCLMIYNRRLCNGTRHDAAPFRHSIIAMEKCQRPMIVMIVHDALSVEEMSNVTGFARAAHLELLEVFALDFEARLARVEHPRQRNRRHRSSTWDTPTTPKKRRTRDSIRTTCYDDVHYETDRSFRSFVRGWIVRFDTVDTDLCILI